uniref:hypothetical protein n=1 Tax=Phocaeicola sp. TaxID=2773926 RepID=UPI003AB6D191
ATVRTHAKYFSFVVRALLDNARKFTREGSVTLRYEIDPRHNQPPSLFCFLYQTFTHKESFALQYFESTGICFL